MIYLEDLRELVVKLEEDEKKTNEYLDGFRLSDSMIVDFILENRYSYMLQSQKDFVLRKYLGEELMEWVFWFIYDVPDLKDSDTHNATVNGVGYKITDIDSFMDFAQHGLCIPMRPKQES